ncbi:unnamed protein product, partial [Cyprideis torosa]
PLCLPSQILCPASEMVAADRGPIVVPRVSPRTIPGVLHPFNKKAIDWGPHGLVAYACHSFVVIVDPQSKSVVQCLDEHKTFVTLIRWQDRSSTRKNRHSQFLASADTSGVIRIWDFHSAQSVFCFQDGARPIPGK